MKLVFLMYLEEDDARVLQLMNEFGALAYSRMSVEGHGAGQVGWYGDVAPYRSRMLFTIVPADTASQLLAAVRGCAGCEDPRHPIHAFQVDVEEAARSGSQ